MTKVDTTPGEPKAPVYNVTLSHTFHLVHAQWIDAQAEKLGVSKSDIVRRALYLAMEADAKQAAA